MFVRRVRATERRFESRHLSHLERSFAHGSLSKVCLFSGHDGCCWALSSQSMKQELDNVWRLAFESAWLGGSVDGVFEIGFFFFICFRKRKTTWV